ncbi:mitochondrial antiviral-signaling protein [Notechis scutatus]|uniref:Mitochondrial antiviral-signaling protein n=1 Tax=Notechis scutatus TaxID=8663 RepID=A0A6J1W2J8_9SAUR|nr:mitochondrial antiviral-signaling protein [Notechis scutatus]
MSDRGKGLAEEEVKRYIYRNLAMFHRVQVNQMIHLQCLTETDRQKIKANCANEGNNETTFLFFQHLCCREGWVMYFIKALREQQMGDLADKLERIYRSRLLPPRTPPAASAPPAASRPSAPPLQPDVSELSRPENFVEEALPWSPSRSAASSANLPPQDMGDYRTPVQENSHPVASRGSPENQTQLFRDPPANGAQSPLKPLLPVPDPERLLPSDLDGSSSVERKLPKPRRDVSAAGGDAPSRDFKLPVEEKMEETTGTGDLAGGSQWGMEPRSSAVGDRKRDGRIFHSNCSENDLPSKPGILSSDLAAEPSKLSSGDAGETPSMYSGSSERLRMSTSDSDPILMSENSSAGHSIPSITRASVAVGATLPPEVGTDEEDTSFRSHHLLMEKNPSMDLMEVPKDGAFLRRSPRAFPDSTSDGQPLNEAKDPQAGPPLPKKKVEPDEAAASSDFRMVVVALALAVLASAAFVLYKKK